MFPPGKAVLRGHKKHVPDTFFDAFVTVRWATGGTGYSVRGRVVSYVGALIPSNSDACWASTTVVIVPGDRGTGIRRASDAMDDDCSGFGIHCGARARA